MVTVLYVAFVLGYAELACALPRAGGAFVYTTRAFGPYVGFVGGAAQLVEYVLAPPAIAFAIGSYINQAAPAIPAPLVAVVAYVVFTIVNIVGPIDVEKLGMLEGNFGVPFVSKSKSKNKDKDHE